MLRMVAAMMIFILVTGCTLFKEEPINENRKKSKNKYIVTLIHYWKSTDFSLNNRSGKSTLSFYSTYEVTPDYLKPLQSGGDATPYGIE